MREKRGNRLSWLSFEIFEGEKVITQAVSTRGNGFSPPPYHSLNLGFKVGDLPQNVLLNRQVLAQELGFSLGDLVTSKQIHQSLATFVKIEDKGKGAFSYEDALDYSDAMVSNIPGLVLMVLTADCLPLLFLDPLKKVVAIAHAGWRGTIEEVGKKTIRAMKEKYGCLVENILVGIGPSIGPCCYEVGEEVAAKVKRTFPSFKDLILRETNGSIHFNLWLANQLQLREEGILEEHMEVSSLCTACHYHLFFSHRQEKGITGRMGALIRLN